jgi:hypothetical protein
MQNDNKGAFFINEKKATENHPTYTGNCTIDGKEYRVSIWPKTSNLGKRFWSMAFTLKEKTEETTPAPSPPAASRDPFADDLPF